MSRWLFHLHIRSALTAVSFFLCVSWNHFLRVTLTYVPINKLATPSQLTRLAETRSSCASVWVNSWAHSTGKDQVHQRVPLSQVTGCRKDVPLQNSSWFLQRYIWLLYKKCKLLNREVIEWLEDRWGRNSILQFTKIEIGTSDCLPPKFSLWEVDIYVLCMVKQLLLNFHTEI